MNALDARYATPARWLSKELVCPLQAEQWLEAEVLTLCAMTDKKVCGLSHDFQLILSENFRHVHAIV